jgi:uncharacterized protein DUF4190
MAEIPTGWQPDPFGLHELRFFSMDGKPTKLVSDGDLRTYDDPPLVPAMANSLVGSGPSQAPLPAATPPSPAPSERPVSEAVMFPPAEAPTRSAFLCSNCGRRHNNAQGFCPQCGVASGGTGVVSPVAAGGIPPSTPTSQVPLLVAHGAQDPPVTVQSGSMLAASPTAFAAHSINGFAVASLVLGLIWLPVISSILAIVFGVIARRQIRTTGGQQKGGVMAGWGIGLGFLGLLFVLIAVTSVALGVSALPNFNNSN